MVWYWVKLGGWGLGPLPGWGIWVWADKGGLVGCLSVDPGRRRPRGLWLFPQVFSTDKGFLSVEVVLSLW